MKFFGEQSFFHHLDQTPKSKMVEQPSREDVDTFRRLFETQPHIDLLDKLKKGIVKAPPEIVSTVLSTEYFHGTGGSIENIVRDGFRFMLPKIRPSSRQKSQHIAGNFVHFTTDYDYALDYSLGFPDRIIRVTFDSDSVVCSPYYRIIEKEVFEELYRRSEEIVSIIYPAGFSDEVCLYFANEALSQLILELGVDILLSTADGSFVTVVNQKKINFGNQ